LLNIRIEDSLQQAAGNALAIAVQFEMHLFNLLQECCRDKLKEYANKETVSDISKITHDDEKYADRKSSRRQALREELIER
jgi:hypothetical protein